jgi:DNA-binding SARP family transcriptional activator/class 3 adenylate cyclase
VTSPDIAVLGPLHLGPLATVLGAKQRRLLGALALEANRAVSADRLVLGLWGDHGTASTTATLHSHVFRLRRHLEQAGSRARVTTAGSGYRLDVEPVALDALLFEERLHRVQHRAHGDDLGRIADLREALGLWRGRAYVDLADDDAAQAESARLDELRLGASEDLADALITQGQHVEALADLETLVRVHPYRDRLWSALILARYRAGRQVEALEAYHTYRRTLDDELGLEPSAALVRLHQDVLEQAPHLLEPLPRASSGPPVAASLRPDADLPTGPVSELKLVTVLVTGPPDGGTFADPADPEDLAEALEPVLSVLADVVHAFGGTVLRAGPSGVVAVFGAPTAAEDHALRACNAAERLEVATAHLLGPGGLATALDSGDVLLQAVRSDAAHGFDAVGVPVEHARRAQRDAPAGNVVVSPATYRLTEGMLVTRPGPTDPDGHPWRLLTGIASSTAWDARARLGLSTLVGRDEQLAVLAGLVCEVEQGSGRVVGLVGDPGVGKSRLAYELTARLPDGWSVLTVAASPLDVAVPFHPLLGTVRELLPEGDLDAASPHTPALAALLGRPNTGDAGRRWAELDPGVQRRRTIAALADLLLQEPADGPLLLLVEDAHWLDGETLAVLDTLVDRISSAPVLLLVTYRPEHDPGWANRPQFTLLRVDPLASPESAALAGALLGDHPSVHALRDQLATWTGGVPLFLEESIRELTETRTLSGQRGDYVLDDAAPPLRLPPRVHGVLAARIDRLPASEKALLQAASVVGTEGAIHLLAAVLGLQPDQVEDDLPGLHRADLLYERRRRGERWFAFKHALVHDTAYASLPRGQRRLMHLRAMEALAAASSGQAEDVLERLAYHSVQAERWPEAVDLNRRAGQRALHRCAYRESAALLTRALYAQRRLPPDTDAEIDLLVQLRPALHSASRFDDALHHLDRAEELAKAGGDSPRLLHVLLHRAYLLLTRGYTAAALEAAQQALALAQQQGELLLVAECRLALGQCLVFAGDPQPVPGLLDEDMATRRAAPLDQRLGMAGTRLVFAEALLVMALSMLGDFDRAERHLARLDRLAVEVDRPIDTVMAWWARGVLELQRGRPGEALVVLRAAQETCADVGMPLFARWVAPTHADALSGVGDHAAARTLLREMLVAGRAANVPLWEAAAHCGLAQAAVGLGEFDDAVGHARAAVALAETWRYPMVGATSLRLLAAASAGLGDLTAARQYAERGLAEAERIGAVPEQQRTRQLLAAVA